MKYTAPLPPPTHPLWGDINPYFHDSITEVISTDDCNELLALHTDAARKSSLLQMLKNMVATRRSTLGPTDNATLTAMHVLAHAQSVLGQHDASDAIWREMNTIYLSRLGPDRSLAVRFNLAISLVSQAGYEEAEAAWRTLISEVDERWGKDSPQALGARRALMEALGKQQGKWEEAKRMNDEAFEIIDGMGKGEYKKFEEEEREEMNSVREKLEEWKQNSLAESVVAA